MRTRRKYDLVKIEDTYLVRETTLYGLFFPYKKIKFLDTQYLTDPNQLNNLGRAFSTWESPETILKYCQFTDQGQANDLLNRMNHFNIILEKYLK